MKKMDYNQYDYIKGINKMSKFVVITDTNCELKKELRERFKIDEVVRAHLVTNDGVDHLSDNDWELFNTPEDFYKLIRDKKNKMSTAPASVEELKEVFRRHLQNGKDIIFLSLSSALSGTYNFAVMAKNELKEEFPDRRVEIVDTLRYSLAVGLLTVDACRLRDEGKSLDETLEWLETNKHRLHEMGPMDDLFYLSRKGRVSFGAAFMGTMVGVKPMGDFSREGLTNVIVKVMGIKKAVQVLTEYVKRTIEKPEEQIIFVAETDRMKNALMIKEALEKEIHPKEIIIITCGPTTGINVGPGLAACFYYGKPISEGNVEEIAIMNSITGKK